MAPDEDENTYLNPSLRGASYATWQSHLAILLKTIKGTPPQPPPMGGFILWDFQDSL